MRMKDMIAKLLIGEQIFQVNTIENVLRTVKCRMWTPL